jgi:lipase maturation factor 1
LIFDGRCGFCRIWIDYWKKITAGAVDFAPSQEVADKYPEIPREAFGQAVQLVRVDGSIASGARAVLETIGWERLYESSKLFAGASEIVYRYIARHRDLFYWLTRLSFGTRIEPARFAKTQWLFLRLLAVIYAIAFGSLATQIVGLVGAHGISPIHDYLGRLAAAFGTLGSARFLALPTIFWWGSSDAALRIVAWAGVALAAMLFFGKLERLVLFLLYALYLSLDLAGQEFLSFQWDGLLLEAGFLAIFFGRSVTGTRVIAWLYRCLVFRLYFLSGYVKLGSGDPSWANHTALRYHYHTQPLPTVIAWYADKLPAWLQRGSTAGVLGIELFVPFLIFSPRRWRIAGAYVLLGLQALIFLTGNYTFFNVLTAALTLFLFDDQALEGIFKRTEIAPGCEISSTPLPHDRGSEIRVPAGPGAAALSEPRASASGFRNLLPEQPSTKRARMGLAVLSVVILTLGIAHIAESIAGGVTEPLATLTRVFSPYQVVNSYGLFAIMTTTRPEIIVEGSDNGEDWQPYEFRYKPGNLYRAPRWIQPFQPRLDWQMWFAALGDYRSNPWFAGLMLRLLEGSPEVLGLLENNPFPDHPPRFVRAELFDYSFTDAETHARTGAWWKRQPLGTYLPPVGIKGTQESPN